MGRPIKNGIDYFSLDTDFYGNRKIMLLRAEFGLAGVGLYLTILAQIYGSRGYYMVWDNDECLLCSQGAASGCTPNLIKEIITGCLRCSLFDQRVFKVFGVLTSAEIQRRYLEAVQKRPRITIIKEYWLLNENDPDDVSANVLNKVTFKSISAETSIVNSEITPVNAETIPQRRSEKRRVNKSRSDHLSKANDFQTGNGSDEDLDDDETKRQIKRIEDDIVKRSLNKNEIDDIHFLKRYYGIESLHRGIDAAIKAGGCSVSYIGKCVETAARSKNNHSDGRYSPTYDISEIEKLLDDEWNAEEGD